MHHPARADGPAPTRRIASGSPQTAGPQTPKRPGPEGRWGWGWGRLERSAQDPTPSGRAPSAGNTSASRGQPCLPRCLPERGPFPFLQRGAPDSMASCFHHPAPGPSSQPRGAPLLHQAGMESQHQPESAAMMLQTAVSFQGGLGVTWPGLRESAPFSLRFLRNRLCARSVGVPGSPPRVRGPWGRSPPSPPPDSPAP